MISGDINSVTSRVTTPRHVRLGTIALFLLTCGVYFAGAPGTAQAQAGEPGPAAGPGSSQQEATEPRIAVLPQSGPPEPNRAAKQPERPAFRFDFIRQDEDWSFLADRSKRADFWDPIKYIPLGCSGCYLTLGGEARAVYEFYDNFNFGLGPQDTDGFVTQRYMLITDWHLGPHLRFFAELNSNLEVGRTGGPRPYDRDQLDGHQGFLEVKFQPGEDQTLTVRAGRQELFYGSGRLVEAREGLNIRRAWDGALLRWEHARWRVDGFATRPVVFNPGLFDDVPDHQTKFWGIYATGPLTKVHNLDLYYFGLDQLTTAFQKGTGRQVRHTFGSRWWGTGEHWDYDAEFTGQVGTFENGSIRAWSAATDHGYRFGNSRWQPRLGIRADIQSGDNDPRSRNLGSFAPLFPRGKYFGEADLNGPVNNIDFMPSVAFNLTRKLRCTPYYGAFWRETVHDGLYSFATTLVRPGNGDARFIGQQAEVDFEYTFSRHAVVRTVYQHFFPGPFLKDNPPAKNVNYVAVWWTYHF